MNETEYEQRLRQRVGEGEYERHKELVRLLARNLMLEDILWKDIIENLRDVTLRRELLRERNQIIRDIHTEFRALNIEIPSVTETKTEGFASFLEDLTDDSDKKGNEEPETITDG